MIRRFFRWLFGIRPLSGKKVVELPNRRFPSIPMKEENDVW